MYPTLISHYPCITTLYQCITPPLPSRSPRKGLMSPKAFVSNGVETRQVFGFDAPFVSDGGARTQANASAAGLTNSSTGFSTGFSTGVNGSSSHRSTGMQQQGFPTADEDSGRRGGDYSSPSGSSSDTDTPPSSHKSKRKSSPPINTPLILKHH